MSVVIATLISHTTSGPGCDLYQEVLEDHYRRRPRVNRLAGALGLPPVQTAADTAGPR
jgi:hypothetical protein